VSPPTIDGTFQPSEWPAAPLAQFAAPDNPARIVQLYMVKDSANYYLAYLVNVPTDDSGEVRTGFDVNGIGGDPDGADRFFIVRRDGSSEVWSGTGSSSDSLLWDSSYTSGSWSSAVGESTAQWVVEMQISSAELASMSNPFNMMAQSQTTGSAATWPGSAFANDLSTWQAISNPSCT
jgi:hypothetical protein